MGLQTILEQLKKSSDGQQEHRNDKPAKTNWKPEKENSWRPVKKY
jgi:hypothetical protein